MQIGGPAWEVVVYGSLVICVLVVAFPNRSPLNRRALVAWCALAALSFVAMKAGFVRHDPTHAVTAWSVATLLPLLSLSLVGDTFRRAILMSSLLLAVGAELLSANPREPWQELLTRVDRGWVKTSIANLRSFGELLRDPDAYRASLDAQRDETFAAIRREDPLPQVDGTVEIMEVRQASLLAHGMKYRPRPSLQGYAAGSAA